ncbi:MAG TPA: hypothetical protein VFD23_04720 [Clostridia bacterium]|nr:hypothetical protein [Clostridia bacterium]
MNIFFKLISMLVSLLLSFSIVPHTVLQLESVDGHAENNKTLTGASSQSSMDSPWAEEISNNGAFAAVVSVPPVIRVANVNYGLDNQALTPADSSTIQTQLVNYSARTMQSYDTTVSVTVPVGATAPGLTAVTQGAGSIHLTGVQLSHNPYTWKVAGGKAIAGNFIDYTVTYNLNGRQYTQKAASYVDYVELAAGWQSYVVRKNFSNVFHTRHEYTATLSGSCSTGAGYAVYGSGGTGYYNMSAGGGESGFIENTPTLSGMKLWAPGYSGREDCGVWYCGQPGKKDNNKDDNVDGGHRAKLDVYYDPSVVTNISQIGIKLLYWRSTSPDKISALAQEKMLYLQGDSLFSHNGSSNTTAESYFRSTNAQNNNSQSINSNHGTMTFNFASTALPPHGQKVTFASAIYGRFQTQMHLSTWNAWLITFHVVDKSALRSLIATEDSAFRQIHDGYTDAGGSFTSYLNQLTKAKAVLNRPNASPAQIAAAVSDLNTAKNNFTYARADYAPLNSMTTGIYKPSQGFRPSIINDPDYYFNAINYYPSGYYIDTSDLENTLAGIVYDLDIRYQAYVDNALARVNSVWRTLVLLDADYTDINYYLSTITGLNGTTGSPAGNYILANATKYPQYAGIDIFWDHFTRSSYDEWETAVLARVLGLKIPDQAAVTAMGGALESAYNRLTIRPADYTELDDVRASTFTALGKTVYVQDPEGVGHSIPYYSDMSTNALQSKLDEFIDGLLMPEQGTVFTWTDDLLALYNAKTLNDADYLYANEQKAISVEFETQATVYYTADSWQALEDARNAVAPGKFTDEQTVVNGWAANIVAARHALVLSLADYSALDEAIARANDLIPANYHNWAVVSDAIDAVVYNLGVLQQSTVDGYAGAITTAIESLVYLDADLDALIAAIDAAALYNEDLYTAASWAVLADAVAAGIIIRDAWPAYTIAQQAMVDEAGDIIEAASENLIYLDADLTALITAINSAATYNEGIYTSPSWTVFANALAAGVAIRDASPTYNITQQPVVDQATAEIDSAIGLLAEAFVGIEVNLAGGATLSEETGYIYGLPANGDLYDLVAQGFIDIIGNGHFVYMPPTDSLGTGTEVELVRNADGKVMGVYTIIIFGDINGDGLADAQDACLADMLACGMLVQSDIGDAAYFAADANHDGLVNAEDAFLLEQAGLFFAQIDQVL